MFALPAEDTLTVLVAGEQTGGQFAIIEARERQGAEPPRHIHSREDEFIFVLDGRLTIELDGERFDRGTGTSLLLPSGSEHTFSVEPPEARLLVVYSPAGFESCLRELARPDLAGSECQRIERMVVTAARFGVTITGPARPP